MELDPSTTSGKFEIAEGFDFKATLAKLSETNDKIAGWSVAGDATADETTEAVQ